jgi:predicted RNase H-like nuclease (RuvC/YqgF family)
MKNMSGKLDEISRAIGAIQTSVRELRRRADEDREIRNRWHEENSAAIEALTQKLDHHATAVDSLRPAVAALELSRSKLATWASIGFAGVVVFGWIVEASVKWAVAWTWSHFQ